MVVRCRQLPTEVENLLTAVEYQLEKHRFQLTGVASEPPKVNLVLNAATEWKYAHQPLTMTPPPEQPLANDELLAPMHEARRD